MDGGSFDEVIVTWTEPAAGVDGYELQGRISGGSWEAIGGLIPRGSYGVVLQLEPTLPELTNLDFRIRSVRGGKTSAWSSEAPYLRGIRPPPGLTATLVDGPAVDLAWSNASTAADSLLLERADADEYGAITGSWSALPAAFGATAHRDAAPHELVHQAYRVRYGKGGVWSREAAALAGPVPLYAPLGLAATLVPGGVRLDWQNRSLAGTRLTLTRWPQGAPVDLATDATTFLDPIALPWPSTRYRLDVSAPPAPASPASTAWCALPAYQVAGPAGTLDALDPPVPWTMALRRSPDGRFAWLAADTAGPTVVRQGDAGLEVHSLSFQMSVNPLLVLDAAGLPHAVGYTPGPGPFQLVHEWLGAGGWTSEVVTGDAGGGSSLVFAVDGLGRLHLLENLQHCVVTGGACTLEPVPQPTGWATSGYASLEVGSDGTALVLTTGYGPTATPVAVATRAPGGGWSVEIVPVDGGLNPEPRLVAGPGGDLGLLFHHNNPANPPVMMDVRYMERRGGAWGTPEDLGPTQFAAYGLAAAPDLSRVVAYTRPGTLDLVDLVLWSRDASGWTGATLASGPPGQAAAGVLGSGKAWIASMPASGEVFPFGPPQPWSLWEER
ncbi:MAG TPA: hypothetical protein VLD85_14835 [Anaeromyxobacteraceae bacterium]|nr:hypothetical protein [Anaeromyxobacteraceae bacterium]